MSTAPGSDSVGTGEIKKTRIIKKILSKMAFALQIIELFSLHFVSRQKILF